MSDVTRTLSAIEQGDPHAVEQLLPLFDDKLRELDAPVLEWTASAGAPPQHSTS
jgi:hypothetical protein